MISFENFSKSYGQKQIFNNINVTFNEPSKIYCLLGPSGSGKTTLFNTIFGIDQKYEGQYLYQGQNTRNFSLKQWDKIRKTDMRIVYQDQKLIEFLSVRNNIKYGVDYEVSDIEIDELLEMLQITDIQDTIVKDISGGEKQRVAFARAIVSHPKILLLDEPTDNLDDENCKIILNYLQTIKKDRIIIIISHDQRVKAMSDVVYQIENRTIISSHQEKIENSDNHTKSIPSSSKKLFGYVKETLKAKWLELISLNIPIVFIFALFIVGINLIQYETFSGLNIYFQGISNEAIILDTQQLTSEYIDSMKSQDIIPSDDGVRIFFSNDDLATVNDLAIVKNVTLLNASVSSLSDHEEFELNEYIEATDFPTHVLAKPFSSSLNKTIYLSFSSLSVPADFVDHYNKDQINLLEGKYPSLQNEIMIPSLISEKLKNDNNLSTLIGESITLNVKKEHVDSKKTYTITGIYEAADSMLRTGVVDVVVAHQEYDFLDLWLKEETYLDRKENANREGSHDPNYINPLYTDYESYKKAIGTGFGTMIVVAQSANDVEQLTSEIKEIFPHLKQVSRYSLEHGDYSKTYDLFVLLNVVAAAIIIVLVSILCFFINKNYLKRRQKEMSILYSLGYSTSSVKLIVLTEYLLTTVLNIVVAFGILLISQQVYFKYIQLSKVISHAFLPQQILMVALFLLLTTFISVIFSINSIKSKNLIKHLKG